METSSKDTPIEKYVQNMKALKEGEQPIILLTTGSYCPVHLGHTEMASWAAQELKKKHPKFRVVAGFISPSIDYYVKRKLARLGRMKYFLTWDERCFLLEQAIQDRPLLSVDKWEGHQPQFESFTAVYMRLREHMWQVAERMSFKKPLVALCVGDDMLKCGIHHSYPERGLQLVVLSRPGTDLRRFEVPPERPTAEEEEKSGVFWVDSLPGAVGKASSTAIMHGLFQTPPYLLEEMLHAKNVPWLKEKFQLEDGRMLNVCWVRDERKWSIVQVDQLLEENAHIRVGKHVNLEHLDRVDAALVEEEGQEELVDALLEANVPTIVYSSNLLPRMKGMVYFEHDPGRAVRVIRSILQSRKVVSSPPISLHPSEGMVVWLDRLSSRHLDQAALLLSKQACVIRVSSSILAERLLCKGSVLITDSRSGEPGGVTRVLGHAHDLGIPVVMYSGSCLRDQHVAQKMYDDGVLCVAQSTMQAVQAAAQLLSWNERVVHVRKEEWWKEKDVKRKKHKGEVVVIGVSGASRCGKSSLAVELGKVVMQEEKEAFVHVVRADKHFARWWIMGDGNGNWDTPGAVDWAGVVKETTMAIQQAVLALCSRKLIIVEGFMVFRDPLLVNMLDHRFWIEIDKETAKDRRMRTTRVSEEYYETKLWPNHLAYMKWVKQLPHVIELSNEKEDWSLWAERMALFLF